jgi:hypothetical protein
MYAIQAARLSAREEICPRYAAHGRRLTSPPSKAKKQNAMKTSTGKSMLLGLKNMKLKQIVF